MTENHRLVIAVFLSALIIVVWQLILPPENKPLTKNATSNDTEQTGVSGIDAGNMNVGADNSIKMTLAELIQDGYAKGNRVAFQNTYLSGSINLVGPSIDDMKLLKYKETNDSDSPDVRLLSPKDSSDPYFISFGWIATNKSDNATNDNIILPTQNTKWTSSHNKIGHDEELKLTWKNPQGIEFIIKIKSDPYYIFDITQSVANNSQHDIEIAGYTTINRMLNPNQLENNFVVNEGISGVVDTKLREISLDDLKDEKVMTFQNNIGWFGFSDKYWLVADIPYNSTNNDTVRSASYKFGAANSKRDRYQIDIKYSDIIFQKGETLSTSHRIFIGAKELDLLEKYSAEYGIPLFDRAVDFGMLYFITKPIFILLTYFYHLIGNFGLAIILLTIVIKIILFPLAYKGFKSMNRLKDLQPRILKIRELYKDDSRMMQKAMMDLYKKENVNPMAGCLPILLQMPVFFALYKVLSVTIAMRHAPFFGWLVDLSAPDPTTIFNLFGLIDWVPPSFLMIGILPILMSGTMYIQQMLNPQPTDPVQAKVMHLLPLILMFMFKSFPSGLVLYWVCSNIFSILQQIVIKRLTK